MRHISKKVANWLLKKAVIEEEELELYEYAVYSAILLISPLLMSLGIGIIFGEVQMGIVLILPFMFIRKFSGGYHAKTLKRCFVLSSFLLALCFYIAQNSYPNIIYSIIFYIASLSLTIFSPIDSENRMLTEDECLLYGRVSQILVIIFDVIYFLLVMFGFYTIAVFLAMGVILSAVLQIPCILRKYFKIINQNKQ